MLIHLLFEAWFHWSTALHLLQAEESYCLANTGVLSEFQLFPFPAEGLSEGAECENGDAEYLFTVHVAALKR